MHLHLHQVHRFQRQVEINGKLNHIENMIISFFVSSKSNANQQRRTSSSSRHSTTMSSQLSYDDVVTTNTSDLPPPLPEDEHDILLLDSYDKYDYLQVENCLSNEIGCPIKLLTSKTIFSENKEKQRYIYL